MIENINRTAAATAKRMRASEEKMSDRLRGRGWFSRKAGEVPALDPRPEACMYATDLTGETHRVVGWTADHKPILDGLFGEYVGTIDYVFTTGWWK